MAGLDWVQVDVGFPMSLAVIGAARSLGMERRAFLGAMVELQIWAVQALPEGRFVSFGPSADASGGQAWDASADEAVWVEALESAVRWTGTPGAFWSALLRARILIREDDGVRLTLCDRYVGVLDKRKKEAERKRRERAAARGIDVSAGRPRDTSGTSSPRNRKEKEKKRSSAAAAGLTELDVELETQRDTAATIPAHLAPVALLPDEDASPDAEQDPIQLSLPGTHLVPATPPREDAPAPSPDAVRPLPAPSLAARAAAFFDTFQDARVKAFRGVPREKPPAGWADWFAQALRGVDGDEARLHAACQGYLQSDWGRARQPPGTVVAFCSPRVWTRYVPQLEDGAEADTSEAGVAVPVEVASSEADRVWSACLDGMRAQGKRYALSWLGKARAVGVEDGHLVLAAPDAYFRQWVEEQYGSLMEAEARSLGLKGVRWARAAHEVA
ncbi:DnaA N-terminal domain-containing protein [Corallococcus exercitus]|uniref:DnaA N-terminal domain-containing protein n=1 Tax=Corallococcus exercitus TaxID=2316736 RepID=UPI0035D5080E